MDTIREITPDDLEHVLFDVQDPTGKWREINAKEATNEQFDTWAKTLMTIHGENKPWSMEDRAHFCTLLWQRGGLDLLWLING